MPEPILRAMSIMRPRLEAERSLSMYEAMMAGSGNARKADVARWVGNMRRIADVDSGRKQRPSSTGEWAALGMRVHDERGRTVKVTRKGKEGK